MQPGKHPARPARQPGWLLPSRRRERRIALLLVVLSLVLFLAVLTALGQSECSTADEAASSSQAPVAVLPPDRWAQPCSQPEPAPAPAAIGNDSA